MPVVTVACSPDADDLFMVRALLEGLIDTGPLRFEIETQPTHVLNQMASEGVSDVVAISVAHYPNVARAYQLLPHGGSLGEGYGPVLVARDPIDLARLPGRRVGIPGTTTTAWLALRLAVPGLVPVVLPITPYDLVFRELQDGGIDAALLIHEGRLTYEHLGFVGLLDLGVWWAARTHLPLPLGGNCIRRDMDGELKARVSGCLRASIRHGLDHRPEAIDWLLSRGTQLPSREAVDRYLAMYANARTLDYGPDGRRAIEALLGAAADAGLVEPATVDFAP